MINSIIGHLISEHGRTEIMTTAGIGYKINLTARATSLINTTQHKIPVVQIIRENEWLLFGFVDNEEREAFETLLKVQGIGPNTALAILSKLTPTQLNDALTAGDVTTLTSIPKIGDKTAKRLCLELGGKIPVKNEQKEAEIPEQAQMAIDALINLGLKKDEAKNNVLRALETNPNATITELISQSLT